MAQNKTDEETLELPYIPTEKEQKSRNWAYEKYEVMWENQSRSYRQLGNLTPQQYLDQSRKFINLLSLPRKDGRSNIKSTKPLNKLMAILARVALKRPDIGVQATTKKNVIDNKRGEVIKDLFTWSEEQMQEDYNEDANSRYFFDAFDCASDGIKIKYEGYDNQTHKRKDITNFDPDTGEVEYEEVEYQSSMCFSANIMPEDFLVWDMSIRNVQRQPVVAWRTLYNKAHFDYEFSGYKNHKYVKTGAELALGKVEDAFYNEHINGRVEKDKIEVARVFDRFNDRMVIVANGVVLQDSPLVWQNGGKNKKKKYPFAKTIFSPFAGGEFWLGMSLSFKLKGDVSGLDTLFNLGIEQEKLAVNPPTLTTSENEAENLLLLPGRKLVVDDINNFKELTFKSPDAAFFNFIDKFSKNIDEASVDPASEGQNVPNTTARGQVIAEENARRLLGIFNLMMESLVLQSAKLRIPNIIQFKLIPGTELRVGETSIDGMSGTREIKIIGEDREGADTPSEIDMIEDMAEMQGINLERLNFTREYLLNIEYSIKVVTGTAFEQAKSIEITLQLEKLGAIAQHFPNVFQSASELFFKDLMEAFGDDAQKYLDAAKQNVNQNSQQLLQESMGGQEGQGSSNIVKQLSGTKNGLGRLTGAE